MDSAGFPSKIIGYTIQDDTNLWFGDEHGVDFRIVYRCCFTDPCGFRAPMRGALNSGTAWLFIPQHPLVRRMRPR